MTGTFICDVMWDSLVNNQNTAIENFGNMFLYDSSAPMLFSSGLFWVLFLLFLPIYALLKRSRIQMTIFVILFSLYFYYKSSGLFFLMLTGTSLVDWTVSRLMAKVNSRNGRKALMWFSIILSLSILGYFKYANFFLWNWNEMVQGNFQPLDIILPVGISFYTFQSISYVVDVYKEKKNLQIHGWIICSFLVFSLRWLPGLLCARIIFYRSLKITERPHPMRSGQDYGL